MALSDAKVTLYDIPTGLESRICSPFTTRIRLVLNIKKIPFDVHWISFPDLQATAKAVGARPTEQWLDGSPKYTIPFLTIESPGQSKIVLTESWTIAAYLDEKVPEPRLFPEETAIVDAMALQKIEDIWRTQIVLTYGELVFNAYDKAGQDYVIESFPLRSPVPWTGNILPEDEQGKGAARKSVFDAFDSYATYLDKSGEGNYRFTPGRLSYTEIGLVAWLHCLKAVGGHTDLWRDIEKANGGRWAKLLGVPEYSRVDPVYPRK